MGLSSTQSCGFSASGHDDNNGDRVMFFPRVLGMVIAA